MIDFWFSVGSTYTYLSVMRLADVAGRSGVAFRWRPFSVRQIMLEMDNIPFRGVDRLDDAIAWHRRGTLARAS